MSSTCTEFPLSFVSSHLFFFPPRFVLLVATVPQCRRNSSSKRGRGALQTREQFYSSRVFCLFLFHRWSWSTDHVALCIGPAHAVGQTYAARLGRLHQTHDIGRAPVTSQQSKTLSVVSDACVDGDSIIVSAPSVCESNAADLGCGSLEACPSCDRACV